MNHQLLNITANMPLSLVGLLLNLFLGLLLALALRWHFQKFATTLSNREAFSQIFPFVLLTTVLIIAIVKSSLALSLGLVGALSIVRFRTPIKEPEELAYLFLSIAMGLGLGADQRLPTFAGGLSIMLIMAGVKWMRRSHSSSNLFLSIDWQLSEGDEKNIQQVQEQIVPHVTQLQLRRFDVREGRIEATYMIEVAAYAQIATLTAALQGQFSGMGITVIDQSQIPSL